MKYERQIEVVRYYIHVRVFPNASAFLGKSIPKSRVHSGDTGSPATKSSRARLATVVHWLASIQQGNGGIPQTVLTALARAGVPLSVNRRCHCVRTVEYTGVPRFRSIDCKTRILPPCFLSAPSPAVFTTRISNERLRAELSTYQISFINNDKITRDWIIRRYLSRGSRYDSTARLGATSRVRSPSRFSRLALCLRLARFKFSDSWVGWVSYFEKHWPRRCHLASYG